MDVMSVNDYKLFITIAKLSQEELFHSIKKLLPRYYPAKKVHISPDYLLCEGDIPILVLAHLDTVFKFPPTDIYYDKEKRVMWSPEGLGADDRAGVFAILKLLAKGLRPHICFTCDEEIGGVGAYQLTNDFPEAPFDIKFCIQLDRRGSCDCVFYDCDNPEFEKYIESFGFITAWGSFTDISTICPDWGMAGVNLSVGYRNEHFETETLNTNELYSTINKVEKILKSHAEAPQFKYIPNYASYYYGNAYGFDGEFWFDKAKPKSKKTYTCANCHKKFDEDDTFVVKSRQFSDITKRYCIDCAGKGIINWCNKCGFPFEISTPTDTICPECAGKKLPKLYPEADKK